ncbi:RHS repeat-associated core domain-containing protein [Lysobacter silvisoli]|uniref:RHS repeat-associated core domain-containing protein n=1 Tax=Lysobacter silvisoli TaxID=2293254 RepID=UPI001E2B498D|nr:RHS repeat-associated core domain-containing protein [Lysobacter silvisoli]
MDYRPSTVYDSATGGLSLHYGYDTAGQLTQLKDGAQSAFLARYDYDNLGRLTVLRDGPSNTPIETYGYDATGNRTSLLHSGVTTSFTYPSTSHRLSSAGGVARTYDGVGNTLTIGGTTKQFNYGEDDRMRSLQVGGTVVRGYAYNALGERVLSTVPGITGNPDGSGGTPDVHTYTVYDESGRWLGDYDTNGAVLQQAIWLDDLPVGLLAGAGAQQKLHYIEPDHLGTPRAVIDRTRNLAIWTWALQGEAFGNSPPNQDPDLDGTNFVFDMRFPGQRYDAATGLNYNYFRDYDTGSGRYVQSDPIGLEGGINSFAYAAGNPLENSDPEGLQFLPYSRNLNRKSTNPGRIPDGAAQRLNVVWGVGAAGGSAAVYAPPAMGAAAMAPAAAAAVGQATKKVCESPAAQEALYVTCVAIGVCQGVRPSLRRIEQRDRLLEVTEGLRRDSRILRPGQVPPKP